MAGNRYIIPFDEAQAAETPMPKYTAQILSDHTSGLFMGIFLEEGGCGPGLHYHQGDQLYFLTQGAVQITFYDKTYDVKAGGLIFIPAGVPHCNWNSGAGTEVHLEMQFPSPHRFKLLGYPVDKPEDVPDEWKTSRQPYIRQVEDGSLKGVAQGLKVQPLADASSGSNYVQVHYAEEMSQEKLPATKISECEQYYLVLQGEMTVEAALQKHNATAWSLVVLPSGVPNRVYNAGKDALKYVSISTPSKASNAISEICVSIEPTGEASTCLIPSVEEARKTKTRAQG